MVAEKPSIARDIYKALSGNSFEGEKHSTFHKYEGYFFNHKAKFTISSVKGHVFQRDFPKQLQNWQKTNPLDLFDAQTFKTDCDKGSTVKHLQSLGSDADIICLWLDNDREGENISFEILQILYNRMRLQNYQQIYRVKFSSLVKRDLVLAFNSVSDGPSVNDALCVEARQIFDLKIGVAFTRFITIKLKEEFAKLKDKLISYGPCQIPTLSLVV